MERTSGTPERSVQTAEACRPEDQMQQMQVFQIQSTLPWLSGQCGWSSAIARKTRRHQELCQFLGITGFYRKFVPFMLILLSY